MFKRRASRGQCFHHPYLGVREFPADFRLVEAFPDCPPELRGSERERGLQSRDYLRGLIDGQKILLQTVKDRRGKYGRYLGEIWLEEGGQWINVNDRLVEKGYAVFKAY